jgi:AraC-like DNA-binding protein/mannose-6-phosphate isomerase-like protein (cupin superfamily)
MNIENRPDNSTHPGDIMDARLPVTSYPYDSDTAHCFPLHRHRRAQLVYASRGVITVNTADGTWVVPPQQAVWVPAGITHEVASPGMLSMRSLYIHPSVTAGLPDKCCVVAIRPLLRELILETMRLPAVYPAVGPAARLLGVLLDELQRLQPVPLHLPLPQDRRLSIITRTLIANPADNRTLKQWVPGTGASVRTLARLFLRDTGMTFIEWRSRLRILNAIERLGSGRPVTEIAYDLGYASPSAFVAMFRKTMGVAPTQYFHHSRDAHRTGVSGG